MTTHSQKLVEVVSTDGGDTWSDTTDIVVGSLQSSRPGTATVAKMDNGEYFMSYEWCDTRGYPKPCAARGKTSKDASGSMWNATSTDEGIFISSPDGVQGIGSPYSLWHPVGKQLIVSSKSKRKFSETPFLDKPPLLPEDRHAVHINLNYGTGAAAIGVLPYNSDFAVTGNASWIDFDQIWSVEGDWYNFPPVTAPATIVLIGSSGWTDYEISADAIVTSESGVVSLVARASRLEGAANGITRYTAAIDSSRGDFTVYRVGDSGATALSSKPVSGGIKVNQTYHLSLSVSAATIVATVTGSGANASISVTDDLLGRGMAGLFGSYGSGGFSNVQIKSIA